MSKQSGFLVKQAAIQQKMIDDAQRITCELMAETLQITLHEEFGWGQVKEFRCRDGSDVVLIHEQLPWDLESIRYQASQEHGKGKEIPLIINSGYRTVAYNSTLKNASKHSQHLYGYAADIHMPGVSIKDLKRYARNVSPNHGGVGVYGSFLHFDKREVKADWTG